MCGTDSLSVCLLRWSPVSAFRDMLGVCFFRVCAVGLCIFSPGLEVPQSTCESSAARFCRVLLCMLDSQDPPTSLFGVPGDRWRMCSACSFLLVQPHCKTAPRGYLCTDHKSLSFCIVIIFTICRIHSFILTTIERERERHREREYIQDSRTDTQFQE